MNCAAIGLGAIADFLLLRDSKMFTLIDLSTYPQKRYCLRISDETCHRPAHIFSNTMQSQSPTAAPAEFALSPSPSIKQTNHHATTIEISLSPFHVHDSVFSPCPISRIVLEASHLAPSNHWKCTPKYSTPKFKLSTNSSLLKTSI